LLIAGSGTGLFPAGAYCEQQLDVADDELEPPLAASQQLVGQQQSFQPR